MTTPLTKPLKRELQIQGRPFVVTLSAQGIKLTLKGKRKGQELLWEDLVSGEAALAVALNASLKGIPEAGGATAPRQAGTDAGTHADGPPAPNEASTTGSGKEGKASNTRGRRATPTRTAKRKSTTRPRSGRRP